MHLNTTRAFVFVDTAAHGSFKVAPCKAASAEEEVRGVVVALLHGRLQRGAEPLKRRAVRALWNLTALVKHNVMHFTAMIQLMSFSLHTSNSASC